MKKRIALGKVIICVSVLYFVIYNTYFGWNKTPINRTEKIFDSIFIVSFFLGAGIYISPIFKLYEIMVNKYDKK